jgi:hypothetical protein
MATEPFYPIHKIETGKYTNGNELITDDSIQADYIGLYHILPNGDYWTHSSPHNNSKKLIPKKFKVDGSVRQYNLIQDIAPANYVSPVSFYPLVTANDYQNGYIMRYFVQKRNNPLVTIQEIDGNQFNTLNASNQPGISSILWNAIEIKWTIRGAYAIQLNGQEIRRAEEKGFKNISNYLINLLEFWK